MAKVQKKTAEEISMHINSLLVWNRMIQETNDSDELRKNMKRFDEAADQLCALGVPVAKYYK
jgi:hypothetical protein